MQLEDTYDLRVNWSFVEIHPETPPKGRPVSALSNEVLEASLDALAAEDGLTLFPRRLIPNTRRAMRLADAAKDLGRESFYRLHRALFAACFEQGRDIGEEAELRSIALGCGLPPELPDQAWGKNAMLDARFARYRAFATAAGVRGVPTYVFGPHTLAGVQDEQTLRAMAADLCHAESSAGSTHS